MLRTRRSVERGALGDIVDTTFQGDFVGPLEFLAPTARSIDIRVHALYNPEINTSYNILPGLMGVVLTMTLHGHSPRDHQGIRARHHGKPSIDAASRERSARRKDCALCNHRRGYVQVGVILCVTRFLFKVPIHGNLFLLLLAALFFIAANLALGINSTVARNQLQAMQMAMFVILPSILLSGFMFPFRGMPGWAQVIGEILPKI